MTTEQSRAVEKNTSKLNAEYDIYAEEKEQERQKEYREKLAKSVPYVGMYESQIWLTSLRALPTEKRKTYKMINEHHK